MQPENTGQGNGFEQLPDLSLNRPEHIPVLPTPEAGIQAGAERVEQRAEAHAAVADATGGPTPAIVPSVALPQNDDPITVADPSGIGAPLVANDDDVIEKEWVDKAKQIIQSTKNDPYKREIAVTQLQREYLLKRYGREVGSAD